jgi:hypothetical protein
MKNGDINNSLISILQVLIEIPGFIEYFMSVKEFKKPSMYKLLKPLYSQAYQLDLSHNPPIINLAPIREILSGIFDMK